MYMFFVLNISFQLIWINTKKHDPWVICWRGCLVVKETTGLPLKVAVPLCIPTSSECESLSSCSLASIWPCQCSGFRPLQQAYSGISLFNLHFPNDVWHGASFHILICHQYFFFGEVSAKVFGPFKNWIVSFSVEF